MSKVLAIVLAGGEGKRLPPMTLDRAKPAVPFAGQYRLVDFVLSNMANAGFLRIVVLTQYKSHSLNLHIARTWRMSTLLGNFVTTVPAQMRSGPQWYTGSADAIFQNFNIVGDEQPGYVCVFGADHIYRMDPRQMLDQHIQSGAGVTVAGIRVDIGVASQFGVFETDEEGRVRGFLEKPTNPKPLVDDPSVAMASMGNYIFTTEALVNALSMDAKDPSSRHDMGGDIVVAAGSTWVKSTAGEVQDFTFTGQRRWVFHVGHVPGTAYGVISTPAIGNVLGNGQQQIVFGSWDHKIYILDAHGRQVGFAYDNADTMWSSPALYRVPGRGPADIFIGSDASGRTDASLPGGRCVGGFLSDFHWSASAINPDTRQAGPGLTRIWYKCLNQSIWSSPAVGVINGTNRAAVVVGTSFFEQPFPSDTNKVFAFYAATGATVPGWPATTAGPALGSPAIGKIGSSNTPAVVETSWLCQGSSQPSCIASNHSEVEAFNGAGRPIWATRLLGPTIEGSAVLTPLRGEVGNDVLVGTSYGVYPIDGDNGRYMFGTNGNNQWATINPACRVFSTLAVAQTATGWEAIESCGGPPQFRFPGELAAFPLPTDPTTKPSWPAFRFNSLHQGSSRG